MVSRLNNHQRCNTYNMCNQNFCSRWRRRSMLRLDERAWLASAVTFEGEMIIFSRMLMIGGVSPEDGTARVFDMRLRKRSARERNLDAMIIRYLQ